MQPASEMPELSAPPEPAPPAPVLGLQARFDDVVLPRAPWLVLLGLAVSSTAACAYLAFSPVHLLGFISRNELNPVQRLVLLLCVLVPCAIAGLAIAVQLFRPIALPRLEFLAKLSGPLVLAAPTLALSVYAYWFDHPLEFLLCLAAVSIAAERLFRGFFEVCPPLPFRDTFARVGASRVPLILAISAGAAYALFLGYFSIQQHQRFLTGGFDLGHYEVLMFNAMHGNFFRSPILWGSNEANNLANHAELAMVLFIPFYAIHPSAEAMLIIQAVMMGGSVIPLFLLCRSALGPFTSLSICFAYLIAASFSSPLFYDFHWLPIAIPFHFLLMFALNTRRYRLAVVAFILALLVREDVALTIAMGATYFITSRRNVKLGVGLMLASLTWFVVMKFVVMRLAGTFDFGWIYADLIAPGEQGVGSVAKTVLTNPVFFLDTLFTKAKLTFLLHLLVPLAFLPWRNWRWALFASGGAAVTLLTTNANDALLSIRFHYLMHWTPYLYAAAILALYTLRRGPNGVAAQRAALATLLFASVLHSLTFGPIFQRSNFTGGFQHVAFRITDEEKAHFAAMQRAKALIPPEASVSATDLEVAHLTTRLTALSTKVDLGRSDFILVDRFHVAPELADRMTQLFAQVPYELVFDESHLLLLKRGARSVQTAQVLAGLGIRYDPNLPVQ